MKGVGEMISYTFLSKIAFYGWVICSLIFIPVIMFDLAEEKRNDKASLFQEIMFGIFILNEIIFLFLPLLIVISKGGVV